MPTSPRRRRAARGLALLLATTGLLAGAGANPGPAAAADAPIAQRTAGQVTADALPTVQHNGVVWDQVVAGNTVYAGGQFTHARPAGSPAGQNQTAQGNLLAYDITTGNLVTSFAPTLNGTVNVLALSPDKTRLYVGGTFTTANGATRNRLAAYSVATGALVSTFSPNLDAQVKAITVTSTAVYVGGVFSRANGVARSRLAAFSPTNGALLGWAPTADAPVNALLVTPNGSKVIAAGAFGTVNGATARGLASLNASTGALLPFTVNTVVRNYGSTAANLSLKTDGRTIYGTGYYFGGTGNFEGVWAADPETGSVKWLADCHGDTYDSQPMNGAVYSVSHHHGCENIASFGETSPRLHWRGNAFTADVTGTVRANTHGSYGSFPGYGSPSQVNWFPDLTAGSFTGQTQAGWTVEGTADYLAIGGEFPRVNGTAQQGLVRFAVSAKAPKKVANQIGATDSAPTLRALSGTAVRVSWPTNWDRDDKQLTYEVRRTGQATPRHTVTTESLWWQRKTLTFTDTGLSPGTTYSYQIRENDPDGNAAWSDPVSVTTGTEVVAQSAYNQQVQADGADHYWRLRESPGATTAVDWTGAADLTLGSEVTLGAAGAVLGSPDTAGSFAGTAAGRAGTTTAAPAPGAFSVEAWVQTTSTAGGKIIGYGSAATGNSGSYDRHLYVDAGGRVTFGVHPGAVQTLRSPAAVTDGEWHHLVGTLSPAGMALYVDGERVATNPAVTGAHPFSGYWRVGGDTIGSWPNAPASPDLDGVIDDVATYPGALTALQVRDHYNDSGRADPTNVPPTAALTASCTGRACTFDGTGSADPDGSIAAYAWQFGDGATATTARPNHAYAAAGSYVAQLTVTDDDGATATASRTVVIDEPPLASDAFGRTASGSWGTADVGGPWSLSPGAPFSVDGSRGRIVLDAPRAGATASLTGVSSAGVDGVVDLSVDKVGTGSGTYATIIARRQAAGDYRLSLVFGANGAVTLAASRMSGGTETQIRSVAVSGLTYTAGDVLRLRFALSGSGPTTLTAKVWRAGSAEPGAPQLSASDGTAGLQGAGTIGLKGYLGGSATNAPVTVRVDNLLVTSS